jgi:uncharacterized membrane protein
VPVRRSWLFALGGLLVGGIVHIAVVMLVPSYASRDAFSSVGRFGPDGAFHVLPMAEPGTEPLPSLDPLMAHAVCRYSLSARPVHVKAVLPDTFWSLAVFDRRGRNVYNLNDKSADRNGLDLVLANPQQMQEIRERLPDLMERSIVAEVPGDAGFVLLRVFVPGPALLGPVRDALAKADCSAPL